MLLHLYTHIVYMCMHLIYFYVHYILYIVFDIQLCILYVNKTIIAHVIMVHGHSQDEYIWP